MRVHRPIASWVALAACVVLLPAARAADEPNLVGAYKCVGDSYGGKQYEGKVSIAKEGDSYVVKWAILDAHYTGLGILDGGTLSVAIRDDADDNYTGVIVYRIEKGGKLRGRWTVVGFKGAVLNETLTPTKP